MIFFASFICLFIYILWKGGGLPCLRISPATVDSYMINQMLLQISAIYSPHFLTRENILLQHIWPCKRIQNPGL